ncbi:PH domain-containing protein [Microbacterium sp.]|uniref:PH domain-containing protein n=1 Tax=Microbacterium sp. TaxID=51671 RepID=UPI0039E561D7
MPDAPVVFRSRFGIVLTIMFWAIAAVGTISAIVDGMPPAVPGAFLTAAWFVWLLFWRPSVVVDADGTEFRNILRDVEIPFSSVETVRTQYALTVVTAGRTYRAWAMPAPSSVNPKHVRPGREEQARNNDSPATAAARLIRRGAETAAAGADGAVTARWQPVLCAISVALPLACVALALTAH